MSRQRILVWLLAACGAAPLAAQTPYEDFKLRTEALADFDRDLDGQLSAVELRNAAQRAEGARAGVLADIAAGKLDNRFWGANLHWGETGEENALRYASRWLSCLESLPRFDENGLVTDTSRLRDLTPWEMAGGNLWMRNSDPDPDEPPVAEEPTVATPSALEGIALPLGWKSTTTPEPIAPPILVGPGAPGVSQQLLTAPGRLPGQPAALPGQPMALPGLPVAPNPLAVSPLGGATTTTSPTPPTAVSKALSTLSGSRLPASSTSNVSPVVNPLSPLKNPASPSVAAGAKPVFQLGTTRVVGVEAPKPPSSSKSQSRERPKATPQAGALGPVRVVPPSPTRAGIFKVRPIAPLSRP